MSKDRNEREYQIADDLTLNISPKGICIYGSDGSVHLLCKMKKPGAYLSKSLREALDAVEPDDGYTNLNDLVGKTYH